MRFWKATDACGKYSNCLQYIIVEDNTAPTLTGTPYAGSTGTNACMANAAAAAPFSATNATQGYSDNCNGGVTATLTNTNVAGTNCAWMVTYTFTITDACGNALSGQTYSNRGSDQTAPALTGTGYGGTTGTNACMANAAAAAPFNAGNAIQGYTDNCGGAVRHTYPHGYHGHKLQLGRYLHLHCKGCMRQYAKRPDVFQYRQRSDSPSLTGTPYGGTTGANGCMANAAAAAPFNAGNAMQGYTDNCGGAVTATLTGTATTGQTAAGPLPTPSL